MHFEEYRQYDGLGLAQLVRTGQVNASMLTEVALARAQAVNPRINALTYSMAQIARARAENTLTGPFSGVPFLLKDLEQHYEGVAFSNGCRGLKNSGMVASHHSEITVRWLNAGVVVVGKTNTSEFGIQPVTEPLAWGPTRNPWDLSRTPGGSSGGAAAAIAAGIVPLAGGNDVGGSIRIPAAACGLFGFKPGRGRTPWGPLRGEIMHGAAINHVITRSVRDSAAMLDASHGREKASPFHLAPPERPYLEEVGRDPGRLRIAYSVRSPAGTEVSPEAVRAVEQSAQLLETLGHHVEPAEPSLDWDQMYDDLMSLVYANTAAAVAQMEALLSCGNVGFEPDTLLMASLGRALRADEVVEALGRWHDYQCTMNGFYEHYDVYLTPTIAQPPIRIGAIATPKHERKLVEAVQVVGLTRWLLKSSALREKVRELLKFVPFTELANITGVPAMSMPLHWTADNLPLGVHFMAGPSREDMLFRLAGQLEQAQPWFDRVPEL